MADAVARKGLPLHLKMLVGFAVGIVGGLLVHLLAPGAPWVAVAHHLGHAADRHASSSTCCSCW